MFQVTKQEIDFAGKTLTLESGKMARQADGAVLAKMGETTVLCTVVAARQIKEGQDFFPLAVHYQEKTYAAGRIPGGFMKREARPSDKATLTSRLIDRPIRPLFPESFLNETQVICTVLSHDLENDPDIVAMCGTSAALTLSGIPFMGPIGGARVGYVNDSFVINPTRTELGDSQLDLIVAGTREGVLMVESEASELSEDTMLSAVMEGHKAFQSVIEGIIQMAEQCAKEPWDMPASKAGIEAMRETLHTQFEQPLRDAYAMTGKQDRSQRLDELKSQAKESLAAENSENPKLSITAEDVGAAFKKIEAKIVRNSILENGQRIDGRDTKTIRPITCEVGTLPLTHGSALFTRGETQALVVATLGTGQDEQIIDALEGEYREAFMLHYNFPPFSTGEAGRFGPPGRREIGHGKLAWRAINPLMPSREEFPYTVRIVSEILESNGSSSMATVCGTSLAMMDAGVNLPRPVAGIAMGLIKESDQFAVLSDILGDEDHLGDMDFKVAGSEKGITALQMDIKITSITEEIMRVALDQAKDGRLHILGEMAKALTGSREEVHERAPRITTMTVPVDKIRDVIGSGGKTIREIVEHTGTKVDIDDDGTIKIAATDPMAAERAKAWIEKLTAVPEVGKIYQGEVVRIVDFGCFVSIMGGAQDGLVHISELAPYRVKTVQDEVSEGDKVFVKIIGIDDRNRIKLSRKAVDQETGEDLTAESAEKEAG